MSKGRIPHHFVQDLLARTDIVDLITDRVPLKKKGSNYMACCPFHQENTPSFTVSPVKQFYYCFGCGANGDAIKFLMEYDHLEFIEAVEELAEHHRIEIPYEAFSGHTTSTKKQLAAPEKKNIFEVTLHAQRFYQWQLRQPSGQIAITYFKERGITGEIAKTFALGFAPEGWDNLLKQFQPEAKSLLLKAGLIIQNEQGRCYDRFRNRVIFPIRNRKGQTIGFGGRVLSPEDEPKYLNSPETEIYHKGRELYGLYELLQTSTLKKSDQIIVVEGYMDVIALVQHGISNVVATLGTATTRDHLRQLFRFAHNLVFCFDGDRAGVQAAERALKVALPFMSGEFSVKVLFLPEGEDPDSLVRQQGQAAFLQATKEAKSLAEALLDLSSEGLNFERLDDRAQFIQRLKPDLQQIPVGPYLDLMLQKISDQTKLSIEQIKSHLHQRKNQTDTAPLPSQPKTLAEKAIAYLIFDPTLAEQIEKPLPSQQPSITILNGLLKLCQQHRPQTTGQLMHHLNEAQQEKIKPFTHFETEFTKEVVSTEFCDIIRRLQQEADKETLQRFIAKSQKNELSSEEKALMQKILHKLKNK